MTPPRIREQSQNILFRVRLKRLVRTENLCYKILRSNMYQSGH